MRSKIVTGLIVFMLVGSAVTLQAQRGAFRGGTRQPVPPQPQQPARPQPPALTPAPVQRFVAAPVQPFGYFGRTLPITPPIITTTHSPIYSNFAAPGVAVGGIQLIYPSSFYGSGVGVFVPNATGITNTTVIVQQPAPQMVFPGQITGSAVNPVPAFQTPLNPLMGVSRAQVIEQFGSPAASLVTQRTETLYFTGGVSIFLQDGKVAAPPRPH
jgi:hypothetical protein